MTTAIPVIEKAPAPLLADNAEAQSVITDAVSPADTRPRADRVPMSPASVRRLWPQRQVRSKSPAGTHIRKDGPDGLDGLARPRGYTRTTNEHVVPHPQGEAWGLTPSYPGRGGVPQDST